MCSFLPLEITVINEHYGFFDADRNSMSSLALCFVLCGWHIFEGSSRTDGDGSCTQSPDNLQSVQRLDRNGDTMSAFITDCICADEDLGIVLHHSGV